MLEAWDRLKTLGERCRREGDRLIREDAWLLDCIHRSRFTAYGLQYRFDRIRTAEAYCRTVPIVSYEDIAPWIIRMTSGESDVLFPGLPVAFECTGGSTGGSKLIPYSEASLNDFRSALLPWLADLIARHALSAGSSYWAISPTTRSPVKVKSNIRVGLYDDEYLGPEAASAFADLSAVPLRIGAFSHVPDWQIATLYWLVRRRDLELISVWSPTFFSTLLDALDERSEELITLLQAGGTVSGHHLPPDRAACDRLRAYLSSRSSRALWPRLKLVSCWADASSKPYFESLKARLPHVAFQGKGLLSTEGIVTVPDEEGHPLLVSGSGFYEFRDPDSHVWRAHQLVVGKRYEVIMTTSGGLYRYRTMDCVEYEGQVHNRPILRFVGRLGKVSDMVGEKLTEEFVADCISDIPGFRILVPWRNPKPGYVLVIDKFACSHSDVTNRVEARLWRNPQYAHARGVGQLDRLSVFQASRPLEAYLQHAMKNGARLGDVKPPSLAGDTDWLDTLMESSR